MEAGGLAIVVLVASGAACGRIAFTNQPDACAPACTTARCGDPDGCGGTCEVGCCVDECGPPGPGMIRCINGVQQTCAQIDATPCFKWGLDVPCTSGACADADQCTYSGNCASAPVMTSTLAAPGAAVCTSGVPAGFTWALVETVDAAPLMIDGQAVTACVMADFGSSCTPRQVVGSGTGDTLMCGQSCGSGTCQSCGANSSFAGDILMFVSPTPDLERFWWIGGVFVSKQPSTNSSGIGISGFETRYVLACRPACGVTGYELAFGGFMLNN